MRQSRRLDHRTPFPTYPKPTKFVDIPMFHRMVQIYGSIPVHSNGNSWRLILWQEEIIQEKARQHMAHHLERNQAAVSTARVL